MKRVLPIFMLCTCFSFGSGCGAKGNTDKQEGKAANTDANKPAAPGDANNPHAGQERVNPHMIPPHQNQPPVSSLGPPRDVSPSGETRDELVDGLSMPVPNEWERGQTVSKMRKGVFVLPGPGGDAQLIVYRFPGGAGTPEQNIERWKGQIEVGEAGPATIKELTANGLTIMSMDARGRFGAQAMPGVPPTAAIDEARMLAAAISGSGDPWYFKAVGPAKTLDLWAEAWTTLLTTLKPAA